MVHITAGTDTYGKVKTVRKTPVVTKFAMLQMVPLYPIQSYYFFGSGKIKKGGVPFFFSTAEATVHGIPLAHVDKTSVVMAYLRAVFGVCVAAGILGVVLTVDQYNGGSPPDRYGRIACQVLLVMFIVGVIGGVLTYVIPLMSKRERSIRLFCGELLGIGVDPALVIPEQARRIDAHAGNPSLPNGPTNQLLTRDDCLHELISVRARIAQGLDSGHLEAKTDALLERLDHLPMAQS